jgi:ATP-dependent Lhr-like helicase
VSLETARAYGRLHPSLRYVIATHLGWSDLRPVQRDAIGPILDGDTTVVLAPTAGGKTEAAILPLFSRILDEHWAPTSVLYIAPLRALLNDLGNRIGDLAGQLGLHTAVWHGDIGQRERRRIVAAAPDLLLTTPESLEVLLSFAGDDRRALLATIRVVVVDEAHAFYGIDRGTHLLALIERLAAWAAHDVQRIALQRRSAIPTTFYNGSEDRARAPDR